MAEDTKYAPKPFLYTSRGLAARWEYDRVPEGYYVSFMNALEREENSLSSRFGYTIVNRDPNGTPSGQNYYFSAPVVSLAKLNFQNNPQRFAVLGDGSLWQRNANTQGPYTELTLPDNAQGVRVALSGQPLQSVVQPCYETALPFLFLYDSQASIKIAAGSSTPELTGIDPPPYTLNVLPYSPLLTLIDNFSASNSYTTSNFDMSEGWAYASVTGIDGTYFETPVDFPQFLISGTVGTGGSASYTQSTLGGGENNSIISPFSSVPVSPTDTVTLSFTLSGNVVFSGSGGHAEGQIAAFYSADSGATWQSIGAYPSTDSYTAQTYVFTPQNLVVNLTGLSDLDTIRIQVYAFANVYSVGLSSDTTAEISAVNASAPNAGIFGGVCNGILSVLNQNSLSTVPISSVTASDFVDGLYRVLQVVTQSAHGLSASDAVSIYATSNDLVDGFYPASVVNSTIFTVPYETTLPLSATGGVMNTYFAGVPSTCVLTDEYSTPYPAQFSAWGFYQSVPTSITSFPIGCWSGKVDTNTTASVGVTADFDLSQNNQVTDEDLIVLTLQVGAPANIASIQLQFDVNDSGYTSSYYQATISSAYYQNSVSLADQADAYDATQNQILADALGLLSGQPVGSTTAQLQPSNYSTGAGAWVAVRIPRGNFLPVGSAGQSGLDWTNITGWKLVITTTATAVTGDGSSTVACNGLYLQWGYGPSSFAGVGYNWRYTYYNANTGTESSPSNIMEFNETYGYLASLAAPFFFRQAAQCQGYYSNDSQVTHVRLYRQGGILAQNWVQTSQWPNVTGGGQFYLKDVISDQFILQSPPLVLDNDPPVTSSLVTPIQTTLSAATTGPGQSIYSTFAPQSISVTQANAVFVPNQIVEVGNANNLEVVSVIAGGTGTFTAILRLEHNAGEQVAVYAVPRTACNLCMVANLPGGSTQVVLAGDPNNPARVYFAKPNQPESFGPENYLDSGPADDPVMALINWRGTAFVATQGTWYLFIGGAKPYLQPTGATHGIVASQGWTLSEGEIPFRASDGWRFFSGADGKYMTLPVEWIFRGNPECLPPQANASEYAQDVFAYFNNDVYGSYISLSGERYRLIWSTVYNRYRQDDIAATAMLWEKDTNQLVVGIPIGASEYAVALDQQYNQDYDDGGWNTASNSLIQTPINLTIQTPFRDLGAPHFPKNWVCLETDANTQGQNLATSLIFNTEPPQTLVLPTANTGTQREKIEFQIEGGEGFEAYSMSIMHSMSVLEAPTLFQENVYAAVLADVRNSFDSYWQKLVAGDRLKLVKQAYCDYSGDQAVTFYLYINGDMSHPYFSFTLPAQANRSVVRTLFPAMKMRLWRMVGVSSGNFQLWAPLSIENKALEDGSGYSESQFGVYE